MFIKYIKDGRVKVVRDIDSIVFNMDNVTVKIFTPGVELKMKLKDIIEICK